MQLRFDIVNLILTAKWRDHDNYDDSYDEANNVIDPINMMNKMMKSTITAVIKLTMVETMMYIKKTIIGKWNCEWCWNANGDDNIHNKLKNIDDRDSSGCNKKIIHNYDGTDKGNNDHDVRCHETAIKKKGKDD